MKKRPAALRRPAALTPPALKRPAALSRAAGSSSGHAEQPVLKRLHKTVKSQGRVSWEQTRDIRVATLPPGPDTPELALWPLHNARSCFRSNPETDEAMTERFLLHLERGVISVGQFSGIEMAREAMELGIDGFQKITKHDIPRDCFVHMSSTEKATVQQQFLIDVSKDLDHGDSCVFGDILERLEPWVRESLMRQSPTKEMSKDIRIKKNKSAHRYLMKHRGSFFGRNTKSYCRIHKKHCLVGAQAAWRETLTKSGMLSLPRKRPLIISYAGVPCTPWTQRGAREGMAHLDQIVHSVWVAERRSYAELKAEDIAFLECHSYYPHEDALVAELPGHTVVSVIDGPELHGWPVKRRRLLAAMLNNSTVKWHGPPPNACQHEYEQRFHRGIVASGAFFFKNPSKQCWRCTEKGPIIMAIL